MKMMGKKEGMTQRFDDKGHVVACTVIRVEPHLVVAIRNKEKEGYNALQLGFGKVSHEKRMTKAELGHFKKAGVAACRHLGEAKVESVEGYQVGQEVSVALFNDVTHIDIAAVSKGKGFQGVIKRHHFAGGPGAHGSSFHRHGGSCGMRTTPGRTLPGQKKAGRMGGEKVTVQNVRILGVDEKRHLLIVAGAVPGAKGSLVCFSPSRKRASKKEKK